MTNRFVGILLLLMAIGYGLEASRLEARFLSDPLGPSAMPLILAGALAVLSIWLLAQSRAGEEPRWPNRRFWPFALLLVGSLFAYAYFLVPLGFILGTTLEVAFLARLFGGRTLGSLAVGAGIAVALYTLFVVVFELSLPTGTLVSRLLGGI